MWILTVAALVVPRPAAAYDREVHFVWTTYLALHVGYTERQAYQIASGNQTIDEDVDTDPLTGASKQPLTVLVGPDGPWANPEMGLVWIRYHCFGDYTKEEKYQRYYAGQPIDDWTGEEWLGVISDPTGQVEQARQAWRDNFQARMVNEGNPGPYLHVLQDCYAHHDFNNMRGHAAYGHLPDWLSVHPERGWQATLATLEVLTEFARQAGVEPRSVDLARLRAVFDEMVAQNPAWEVGIREPGDTYLQQAHENVIGQYQNFTGPAASSVLGDSRWDHSNPDLDKSRNVVARAIHDDYQHDRLPPRFEGASIRDVLEPSLQPDYTVFDIDRDALMVRPERRNRKELREQGDPLGFVVEKPEIAWVAETSEAPRARVEREYTDRLNHTIDVQLTFEVSGVSALENYGDGLPIYTECKWSPYFDTSNPPWQARSNGSGVLQSRIYRTYDQIQQGLEWTCTLWGYGLEPITETVQVEWTGPPPAEPGDPDASQDLLAVLDEMRVLYANTAGTAAELDDVCRTADTARDRVGLTTREARRGARGIGKRTAGLEALASELPGLPATLADLDVRAYDAAEKAAMARSECGQHAMETCVVAERILAADNDELRGLQRQARQSLERAEAARDGVLAEAAQARQMAERATASSTAAHGFDADYRNSRVEVEGMLPRLEASAKTLEATRVILEGARGRSAVLDEAIGDADQLLARGEQLSTGSREDKEVVRSLKRLRRDVGKRRQTTVRCLDKQSGRLGSSASALAAQIDSWVALRGRLDAVSESRPHFHTLDDMAEHARNTQASADAAELFPDSVDSLVDDARLCLQAGDKVVDDRLSPAALVEAHDCSAYGNSYAGWDRAREQPACFCPWGTRWATGQSGPFCEEIPPPTPAPFDPRGPECQYDAATVQMLSQHPEPFYQAMGRQTADLSRAKGCDPALIDAAESGTTPPSGGPPTDTPTGTPTGGDTTITSGTYPQRHCAWSSTTGGVFGTGGGETHWYCGCRLYQSSGSWDWVDAEGDWECGPFTEEEGW